LGIKNHIFLPKGINLSNALPESYSQTGKESGPIATELKIIKEQAHYHKLYSSILQSQGKIQESFEHYKMFAEMEMKIKNEKYEREIEKIKNEYEFRNYQYYS